MKRVDLARTWLSRAASNFKLARIGDIDNDIFLEDLCYNAQQCAEKSFKAFCIFEDILFPKTHNLSYLIEIITNAGFKLPAKVRSAALLTDYSVETRYPGDYDEVTLDEYRKALAIANDVYHWVEAQIIPSDQ